MGRVKIAFLWHQHQPYYKDLTTANYILPWARLHAVKDYYNMVKILEDFPTIHQTINLVPSLMVQLEDYTGGKGVNDLYLQSTLKPAHHLEEDDKSFILKNFFSVNIENIVKAYPRYQELLIKRGYGSSPYDIKDACRRFKPQDFLDLQVWFNLAWFDPTFLKCDPELTELLEKGRGFSEADKTTVVQKGNEIISKVVDKHRELFLKGQIDITTTPFYHPILPLICDTDIARVSLPSTDLPRTRFHHPEDAKVQIDRAIEFYRERFGISPKGMWPAEGGVSDQALSLFAQAGVGWIASDEEILAQSLGKPLKRDGDGILTDPDLLYRPYLLRVEGREIIVVFRDHLLSDLIGFTYSNWNPTDAAKDMVGRLLSLSRRGCASEYLVSIMLDGENAWEFYRNNGRDFLYALYQMISDEPSLQAVTISEYLESCSDPGTLDGIFPGSWIDHNFRIWIGGREDNLAWEYLGRARDALVGFHDRHRGDPEYDDRIAEAWEEIYIAEGSDWFWWYGDDQATEHDQVFDELFRKHLINVYELIGKDIPEYLFSSIVTDGNSSNPLREPVSIMGPSIDGRVTTYYEWSGAGNYSARIDGTNMHRAESTIREIFYGFDYDNLYLRIDYTMDLKDEPPFSTSLQFQTVEPSRTRVVMPIDPDGGVRFPDLYHEAPGERWKKMATLGTYCMDRVIEIKLPFSELGALRGERILFCLSILRGDNIEIERIPRQDSIAVSVPTLNFESAMWSV